MTTAINNHSTISRLKPYFNPNKTPTELKTSRVWLGLAAIYCTIGSSLTLTFAVTLSPYFLIGAVPFFLVLGGIVWYHYTQIDFDNPQELAKVRQKAAFMSLSDITQKYGWDKLFNYELISPEQFQRAFHSLVSIKSLAEVINFYEKASQELSNCRPTAPFFIPHPFIWRWKFAEETASLSCSDIARNYHPSIQKLCQYEILSSEQKKLLLAADQIHREIRAYQKECEALYEKEVAPQEQIRKRTKELARLAYDGHEVHYMLNQIEDEKRREQKEIENWTLNSKQEGRPYWQIEKERKEKIQKAQRRYERLRSSLKGLLVNERKKRDVAYNWADRTFELMTSKQREERDLKIKNYEVSRLSELHALNRTYNHFFRSS